MMNGMMTFGMVDDLHLLDFVNCDDWADVEPWTGNAKVQAMRDGNVYITELPKKHRGKPLFRDDNCSLSLGRDGKWYFVGHFDDITLLPKELTRQAQAIARKVNDRQKGGNL